MANLNEEGTIIDIKSERLPERTNFMEWYNALLHLAEIAEKSYPVKGTFIWMPYGLGMMKKITGIVDVELKKIGVKEVLFPLFVTMDFAQKNDKWFNGFKEEAFYIDGKELLLRPTGEPAMYPIFSEWARQGKLPIRIYQTVSSFRNESKTTHSLIRDREITFWHEIHTAHKTVEEARHEADMHRKMYSYIWNNVLNIPDIVVSKPKYEIFAGADSAFEFYTILPDGRLLENGSVNNLGQSYAKKFDVCYTNENGSKEYAWQVCTGNGARFLAAVISIHGDDKGLVVPPKIAPIHVIIVPITKSTSSANIIKEAESLRNELILSGIEAEIDNSDITAGKKFHIWEIKGVPVRIELGEKEISENTYTIFRRDQNKKYKIEKSNAVKVIMDLINKDIPKELLAKAKSIYSEKIIYVDNLDEAKAEIYKGRVAKAIWCEEKACFEKISSLGPSIEPIGSLVGETKAGKCIACAKAASNLTLFGRTY